MPVSKCSYSLEYLCALMGHCFWRKNATKVCDDEEDVSGKIAIVTGSNCGIGKAIAMQLAKRNAVVIMAVRDLERGNAAKEEIEREESVTGSKLTVMKVDLGDISSIYKFVQDFESIYPHLNLLVNNAGVMNTEKIRHTTKDGFELHMGVNHLGTFLLTKLLLESLRKGAPSRVVTLASTNLSIAKLDFEDFMMDKRVKSRDGYRDQYNISKLAISMCTRKLVRDLRKDLERDWKGVKFYVMCPGMAKTPLFRNDAGCWRKCQTQVSLCTVGLSVHQGSETAVFLSVSRSVAEGDDVGNAEMYRFKKVWRRGEKILKKLDDSEEMDKLYKLTEQLLELHQESAKSGSVVPEKTVVSDAKPV